MNATINDVAREAKVSITTVSRVVNNNYPVKKETRERIENAIKKLNYKPNIMARSLITKKTSVIGVVVPGITNLFFPTIVEAIEKMLKKRGYSITLCNTAGEGKEEERVIQQLIGRQVDGIIVIDPSHTNIKRGFYEKLSIQIPYVIVNGVTSTKGNHICYNEEIGTLEAFNYLKELGHKKIAFVRGEKSYSYDLKEKIYLDFLQTNDLSYSKIINLGKGNSLEVVEAAETKLKHFLKEEEKPTAIFACNDLMAIGTMNAIRKYGFMVPEDISVIGFDNTLVSNITHPRLTTVDLKMNEIGKRAAEEIINIIESETNSINVVYSTKLIVRESCGFSKKPLQLHSKSI